MKKKKAALLSLALAAATVFASAVPANAYTVSTYANNVYQPNSSPITSTIATHNGGNGILNAVGDGPTSIMKVRWLQGSGILAESTGADGTLVQVYSPTAKSSTRIQCLWYSSGGGSSGGNYITCKRYIS